MKNIKILIPVILFSFLTLFIGLIYADDNVETTLNQLISEANLSVDIVDGSGNSVVSPAVTFPEFFFSFEPSNSEATLGTSTEKIRVSNPTETDTWSVSIAAIGGAGAVWSDGGTHSYSYNHVSDPDEGRLTVDPETSGTVDPNGCTNDNVTRGSSATFISGSVNSITLLSATEEADTLCYWDLTNVELTQRIPGSQPPSSYSLGMVITIL